MINQSNVIRISLKSHDYKLLEKVIEGCTKTIKLSGGKLRGPVRLPNTNHLITLLTSPHVYKTALEQFSLKIHKVILDVHCGVNTLSALKELDISGGVEIDISIKKGKNNEKK
jgi:small subunit ribosomal protein S10